MGSASQQQGSGGSTGGRRMGVAQPESEEGVAADAQPVAAEDEAGEAADGSDELDMEHPQNAPARRGMTGHRPGGGATV